MPASLLDHVRAMARNNRWCNDRLHRACAALDAEAYHARRAAFFRSIHGTLNHIVLVDRCYLARLRGETPDPTPHDAELYADHASLWSAQRECDDALVALCDALDDAGLERVVGWQGLYGPTENAVHAVLAHLFQHQIHHRGQVHQLLSEAGASPPQLDEFFLSADEPLRRDEVAALERAATQAGSRAGR